MTITHAPPARLRRPHVHVWLLVLVALGAVLIGLAAWVLAERSGDGASEAARLIDRSTTAMSAHDAGAVRSLYADTAVLVRDDGAVTVGARAIGDLLPLTSSIRFRIRRVAPVTVAGAFASTFLRYTSTVGRGTELTVIQFRQGRIQRQWLFKLGVTPPFDRAAVP